METSSRFTNNKFVVLVVPLHPLVPNPYTLLSEIPERAKYLSVIDFKDAFFSVPLVEES